MNSPAVLLDQVVADLDRLLGADVLLSLSDAERLTVLATAGAALRRVEAVVVETVATADPVDFAHDAGCRSTSELLQRTLRVESRAAGQVVKASGLVRRERDITSGGVLPCRWPLLREALLDGVIGVGGLLGATTPIDAAHDRIGAADRWTADAVLADVARGFDTAETGDSAADEPDTGDAADEPDTADTGDSDEESGAETGGAVGAGPVATPEDLKIVAHAIATQLDPDGAEPVEQVAMSRRYLSVGGLRDGVYAIRGNLLPEVYAQLQLIFDAQLNPKTDGPPVPEGVFFRPSTETGTAAGACEDDPFNTDPRNVIDSRTRPQKQHDALAAALGIAARHEDMPNLGGAAPTLVVHLEASAALTEQNDSSETTTTTALFGTDTSENANTNDGAGFRVSTSHWARIPGVEAPVSAAVARHTGCTGAIQRVFTEQGRIVGITVTDRVFTVYQRRAITLRDRECVIPGCHVPASWCEIHHVHEHARGGPTHTDNGVPLCWWHHRSLDTANWEIRMNNGLPEIRGPAWWDPAQHWRTPQPSLPTLALT